HRNLPLVQQGEDVARGMSRCEYDTFTVYPFARCKNDTAHDIASDDKIVDPCIEVDITAEVDDRFTQVRHQLWQLVGPNVWVCIEKYIFAGAMGHQCFKHLSYIPALL